MKKCGKCHEEKELSEFYNHKSYKDGKQQCCIPCFKAYQQNPERRILENQYRMRVKRSESEKRKAYVKDWQYKKKYGITTAQYNQKLIDQKGKCAICSKDHADALNGLYVDHDHESNQVRELLCRECNVGIGFLQDSEDILFKAIEYLRKHKKEKLKLVETN